MSRKRRRPKQFHGPAKRWPVQIQTFHPNQPAKPGRAGTLRIVALGGLEEVGRNSMVLEYERDIIIVDLGLQFPEEDMPGVDYIIPDTRYLRGKEKNIRGIFITHGHYDHIGGIPHLAPKLGNPPIYSSDLTLAMIAKKEEDINPRHKLRLHKVTTRDRIRVGAFTVEFLGLSHNIPASLGLIITTPVGTVVHTGDFKIDQSAEAKNETEFEKIKQLGRRNVLALLCDSTNASQTGQQFSERDIQGNLEQMFKEAKGRMIFATFSSLLSRIQQIIRLSEQYGRKVLIEGFSMKTNVEIAQRLGYLKVNKGTLISPQEAKRVPNQRLVIMSTGAQGEDRAVLMRIVNREHKYLRIEKNDLVIFSSSVVPGNERAVQRLKDGLYRAGAEVIDSKMLDIHAGGHAKSDDLRWFIRSIRPRYFMPIEGNHSFLKINAKLAQAEGIPPERCLIADNGQVVEFNRQGGRLTNERIPTEYVFVDGLGVGDVSHVVLRDRKQLADEGMLIIVATVEGRTGRPVGKLDVISRGFSIPQSQDRLLGEIKRTAQRALIDREPKTQANDAYLKNKVRLAVERLIYQKTERQPMILPVIIET